MVNRDFETPGLLGDQQPGGALYVVATPIGNLRDMTLRALDVLRQVDLIAAEDTRRSKILCDTFEIRAKLIAVNAYTESKQASRLIAALTEGKQIAYITDAGTPTISDPGARLVATVIAAGHRVVPIPGVSAVSTLLSVAGVYADRYLFIGFLPRKVGPRERLVRTAMGLGCPIVIFESPMRVKRTALELRTWLPPGRLVIGRELTKKFEQISYLTSSAHSTKQVEIIEKGEFTIVWSPVDRVAETGSREGEQPVD